MMQLPRVDEGRLWWRGWSRDLLRLSTNYPIQSSGVDDGHLWFVEGADMAKLPEAVRKRFEEKNRQEAERRARRRQADAEALAYIQPLALVWLDIATTGQWAYADDPEWAHGTLEDVLQFGPLLVAHTHKNARGFRHWVQRSEGPRYTDVKHVHCRYCGIRLIAHSVMRRDYTYDARVAPHVTQCALECLAGLRIPVAPGTSVVTGEDGTELHKEEKNG